MSIDAIDLHNTIRREIDKWAEIYRFNVGHQIQTPYLASLANDISFELGIIEAQAIEAQRAATVKQGAVADESAVAESDAPKGATR